MPKKRGWDRLKVVRVYSDAGMTVARSDVKPTAYSVVEMVERKEYGSG